VNKDVCNIYSQGQLLKVGCVGALLVDDCSSDPAPVCEIWGLEGAQITT
jgi:hypothetical protein